MLPLMLASADAFPHSYRCLRLLSFPSLRPHIQCPSSLLCGPLLCFPSAFLNNYTQTQSVAGTKHCSGGDFDLLFSYCSSRLLQFMLGVPALLLACSSSRSFFLILQQLFGQGS